jgi:hypothetical protein
MDIEPIIPDEAQPTAVQAEREPEPERETIAQRLNILHQACGMLREQINVASGKSDQRGFHQAQVWLTEAERALRKAAVQCEEAEAAAAVPTAPVGEV